LRRRSLQAPETCHLSNRGKLHLYIYLYPRTALPKAARIHRNNLLLSIYRRQQILLSTW